MLSSGVLEAISYWFEKTERILITFKHALVITLKLLVCKTNLKYFSPSLVFRFIDLIFNDMQMKFIDNWPCKVPV